LALLGTGLKHGEASPSHSPQIKLCPRAAEKVDYGDLQVRHAVSPDAEGNMLLGCPKCESATRTIGLMREKAGRDI